MTTSRSTAGLYSDAGPRLEALGEGDVCFYDGSHVARPASDVVWIFERGQTWNEQYVLQAFLMYNREFAPLLCTVAALNEFGAELRELFAAVPVDPQGGSSVWLRRLPGPGAP